MGQVQSASAGALLILFAANKKEGGIHLKDEQKHIVAQVLAGKPDDEQIDLGFLKELGDAGAKIDGSTIPVESLGIALNFQHTRKLTIGASINADKPNDGFSKIGDCISVKAGVGFKFQ